MGASEGKVKRTIALVPKFGGFNQHIATHAMNNFQLLFVSFIQYSKVLKERDVSNWLGINHIPAL